MINTNPFFVAGPCQGRVLLLSHAQRVALEVMQRKLTEVAVGPSQEHWAHLRTTLLAYALDDR
jgi:hypothetical protein